MYSTWIAVLWSHDEVVFDTSVLFISTHYFYVNCVPRVCLDGTLSSHEVCVCLTYQRSPKKDTSWHSAC